MSKTTWNEWKTNNNTEDLFEELEVVRSSGAVNMLDKNGVQDMAMRMNLDLLDDLITSLPGRGEWGTILSDFGRWKGANR